MLHASSGTVSLCWVEQGRIGGVVHQCLQVVIGWEAGSTKGLQSRVARQGGLGWLPVDSGLPTSTRYCRAATHCAVLLISRQHAAFNHSHSTQSTAPGVVTSSSIFKMVALSPPLTIFVIACDRLLSTQSRACGIIRESALFCWARFVPNIQAHSSCPTFQLPATHARVPHRREAF